MGRKPPALLRVPLLLLAVLLAGCVHVDQTLTLNPDGSGLIHITWGMAEDRIAEMQALAQAMMAEDEPAADPAVMPFDFSDEDVRQDFKEYEPYGVTLESVRTEVRDGWKYRILAIRFRSLAGLAKTGFLSDRSVSLTRNADGNYVFVQAAGNGGAAEIMPSDPLANGMMEGFRAVIRVQTPGRILDANAPEKTDRTAAWTFDLEKDPDAVKDVQQATLRLVFEGRGLNIPEFRTPASAVR